MQIWFCNKRFIFILDACDVRHVNKNCDDFNDMFKINDIDTVDSCIALCLRDQTKFCRSMEFLEHKSKCQGSSAPVDSMPIENMTNPEKRIIFIIRCVLNNAGMVLNLVLYIYIYIYIYTASLRTTRTTIPVDLYAFLM